MPKKIKTQTKPKKPSNNSSDIDVPKVNDDLSDLIGTVPKRLTVKEIKKLQYEHVIAHIDRLVLTISIYNADSLKGKFKNLMERLIFEGFRGRDQPKWTGEKDDILQFELEDDFTKIKLRLDKRLNAFWLNNKRFPDYGELRDLGYNLEHKGARLLLIEIIDRQKWNPPRHVDNIITITRILSIFVSFNCNKLEIALDTRSQEYGMLLRKCACLFRPPKDNSLWHHNTLTGKNMPGPSYDGNNEYMGWEPKGRDDDRPSSERPRGGRRQTHAYNREVKCSNGKEYTVYRFELLFYRDYLRYYMNKNGLDDLLLPFAIERLVKDNVRLVEIDRKKLKKDQTENNLRGLKNKSTKGQLYCLHKHGMLTKEIKKYLKTDLEWPRVRYIVNPRNCEEEISDYDFVFLL